MPGVGGKGCWGGMAGIGGRAWGLGDEGMPGILNGAGGFRGQSPGGGDLGR